MRDHVRILAILNIVLGGLGMLVGLGVMLFLGGLGAFGAAAGSVDNPEAFLAFPIMGAIGGFVFLIMLIFSTPQIIGGIGLLKGQPWARILMIVLSALGLINVPIGTLTGAYGLWVLLNEDTRRMFESAPTATVLQPQVPQ
jgi:hypothetical protein